MKIYLVGGAVRDQLLNRPVTEKDWVVVGANTEDMLHLGYRQVGKDFPVFIHPETGEEYALARTERKVSRGYTGFVFDTSPQVTLEEDLQRRDLTINAMAQTEQGTLIDPYHGKEDINHKILRHVSPAFVEDPVRVLRVARFAARYRFSIAPETMALMRKMVISGEVDALVPERVWKELERGLGEEYPDQFFLTLEKCGALKKLFSEWTHPVESSMTALLRAAALSTHSKIRFAVLMQFFTHDQIQAISDRYRLPTDYRELALLIKKQSALYQQAETLTATQLVNLFYEADAFRREERFKEFLLACEACSAVSHTEKILHCYEIAKAVDTKEISANAVGKDIAEQIKKKRTEALE